MKTISNRQSGFLIVSLLVTLSPAIADAHAFLDHADPRVGSRIDTSPAEIRIWFSEEIEPSFSVIEVRDSNGNQVDKKDVHVDQDNSRLLIVSVPKLADGKYTVTWKVVAVDTHHTQGDFTFTLQSKN